MKKIGLLFCMLVIASLIGFTPMTAHATIDLEDGTGQQTFANEIIIDPVNGTPLTHVPPPLGTFTLTSPIGFGLALAGTQRYIRLDLDGAEFATAPNLINWIPGSDPATNTVVSSGPTFAIIQIISTAAIPADRNFNIQGQNYIFFEKGATVTYTQYETAVDANTQANPLYTSGPVELAKWADGLCWEKDPVQPKKIDVNEFSEKFESLLNPSVTPIGKVFVGLCKPEPLWTDGFSVEIEDLLPNGATFGVSGNFSAAKKVFLSKNILCTGDEGEFELNDPDMNNATIDADGGINTGGGTKPLYICYEVTTEDVISPTEFYGSFLVTDSPVPTGTPDIDLGLLSELKRNGANKAVYNIPKPDGVDAAFIRITNTSNFPGPIFGRLYLQDGTRAWTGIINQNLAKNATMILGPADWEALTGLATWDGRARLVVEGAVPNMEVLGLVRSGGILTNMSPVAPDASQFE